MIELSHRQQRQDSSVVAASYSHYQTDFVVAQYCDAHYGPSYFGVGNFSQAIVQLCFQLMEGRPLRRALDLGCAVGRSSFELATAFDQVVGVDYSQRFIELARRIQKRGRACYNVPEEGELISDHKVYLRDLGLAESAERVSFYQGDAQSLNAELCGFDLILAANLIDRLPHPAGFLLNIHRHLNPNGLLVIASPYNWLEEYTPKKYWLGGRFRFGCPVNSLDGLKQRLGKNFSLLGEPVDLEFVIRETARSYRHNVSQVSCWGRVEL